MSSSRPKLKLDEQSFQDMLAAAFIIQEHNAKRKRAVQPQHACGKCGAPVKEGELLCARCTGEELRPGEQMQRKWASLWLMSQEQRLWPERSPDRPQSAPEEIPPPRFSAALEIPDLEEETTPLANEEAESEWPGEALADLRQSALPREWTPNVEPLLAGENEADVGPAHLRLRDLRLKLRFHRADLYLVVAIIVSTFAMLWVLSATPAPSALRKPHLRPWERALVSLGLAEAPEPPPRRGNPTVQVWVDPRTALYYCYGEEQYGQTPGGRVATQREAQMDQFEPAGRAACE
jgi:predicted nucleic acid-binding Zn ribbon protein